MFLIEIPLRDNDLYTKPSASKVFGIFSSKTNLRVFFSTNKILRNVSTY